MTREEIESFQGIEQPYCFETDREEDWYKIGCIDGLDAADTDPDTSSLWHDASEMPKEETWILATNEKDIIDVYHLRKGRKYNFDGNLIDWSKFVVNFNLTKWAYIDDLLPKQFENSKQLKGKYYDNNA